MQKSSEDQLATVRLKAPTISLIPLFWIFPLNMLAWLDDDWYETTMMDHVQVNDITLYRFKTVLVKPGKIDFYAMQKHIIGKSQIGGTRYSYGSCTCTETEGKDKKKEKNCEKTVTSTSDYIVTARDEKCRLFYPVQANKHYAVFIRKKELSLQDESGNILESTACGFGSDYTYDTTESSSSTESCSY